jgi:hypothetical protein
MSYRFRFLGAAHYGLVLGGVRVAQLPEVPAAQDSIQLRWLTGRVKQRTPGAEEALREFVETTLEPYYRGAPCSERQRLSDVDAVCATVREVIESGALLRAEFLPSLTETLAWQLIKNRLRRPR